MIYDLFSEIFGDDFFTVKPSYGQTAAGDAVCPLCRTRLSEMLKSGKFGCGKCYDTFGEYTRQILSNVHSTSVHKGKVSQAASEQIKLKRELERLKGELREAIEKQEFENAASLRDKIKDLEREAE